MSAQPSKRKLSRGLTKPRFCRAYELACDTSSGPAPLRIGTTGLSGVPWLAALAAAGAEGRSLGESHPNMQARPAQVANVKCRSTFDPSRGASMAESYVTEHSGH